MRRFLTNFWVCLGFTLVCAFVAAGYVVEGRMGWAWFNAIIGLLWLNDARRALNRGKEEKADV